MTDPCQDLHGTYVYEHGRLSGLIEAFLEYGDVEYLRREYEESKARVLARREREAS